MNRKKKIVRYAAGIDSSKSTDDVKWPKWKSQKIDSNYVKVYPETIRVLSVLSPSARIVLDYAVFKMDEHNFVSNDALFKEGINELAESLGKKPYSSNTINKAFTELCGLGVMHKNTSIKRGIYQISPNLYYKGSEDERVRIIRKIKEIPFYEENTVLRKEYYMD